MEIYDSDFLTLKAAIDAATEYLVTVDRMRGLELGMGVEYRSSLTKQVLEAHELASKCVVDIEGFMEAGT